jgi:hypothetical protein
MTTKKHHLKFSFHADDKTMDNYNKIVELMAARGEKPTQGKDYSQADIMRYTINNFFSGNTGGGRKKTGAGTDVLKRIHDAVQTQIDLNKKTDKTIKIGRGRNEVMVKYEQRTITDRFMRETANANASAVDDYLKGQVDMIEEHNKWLVANCGYPVDSIENEAIANFNRRTAKAEKRADKEANEVID